MKNFQDENNGSSSIKGLIENALGSIKNYVDMDTLIGEPLTMGEGVLAYPIIKVSVGIVAGGGQYSNKLIVKKGRSVYPFVGGTGAGFSAEPIGFLIVNKGKQELVTIQNENAWSETISKLGDGLSNYLKNISKNKQNKEKKEK